VQTYLSGLGQSLSGVLLQNAQSAAGLSSAGGDCTVVSSAASWFAANPPPQDAVNVSRVWAAVAGDLTKASSACQSGNGVQLATSLGALLDDFQAFPQAIAADGH
jgi:hypothetical protein